MNLLILGDIYQGRPGRKVLFDNIKLKPIRLIL